MAKWIRRLTTNQEIPGSTPGSLVFSSYLFFDPDVSLMKCFVAFPRLNPIALINPFVI
ncbi:uncharacterized protein BYT42DRAFT_561023 [Radiomyces spectabilis]|uniref:uncharacterized protein n=1 Tax=Radiomyces spectabilis TaxID=64574 RepID=UPI0022209B21|nr:uncharacterized protein BYT42DRAFT_561023 [Radiomyces spectabilis]KAI8388728.1 hypothetical protein BYT42DRAFT_561023 [Radiomyces spectabilis]